MRGLLVKLGNLRVTQGLCELAERWYQDALQRRREGPGDELVP